MAQVGILLLVPALFALPAELDFEALDGASRLRARTIYRQLMGELLQEERSVPGGDLRARVRARRARRAREPGSVPDGMRPVPRSEDLKRLLRRVRAKLDEQRIRPPLPPPAPDAEAERPVPRRDERVLPKSAGLGEPGGGPGRPTAILGQGHAEIRLDPDAPWTPIPAGSVRRIPWDVSMRTDPSTRLRVFFPDRAGSMVLNRATEVRIRSDEIVLEDGEIRLTNPENGSHTWTLRTREGTLRVPPGGVTRVRPAGFQRLRGAIEQAD